MISRLPKWVWLGGCVLAFIAGSVNVVGLLGLEHHAVSHVTGTASQIGVGIAQYNISFSLHLALILVSFFVGASISGIVIRTPSLQFGMPYGIALIIESGLLLIAYFLLNNGSFSGDYFASMACGLQNGLATTYSGAVIRTTHMTGILTDLGIIFGNYCRGIALDFKKVKLYASIFVSFILGSCMGAVAFMRFSYHSMILPILLTGIIGVGYMILKTKNVSSLINKDSREFITRGEDRRKPSNTE